MSFSESLDSIVAENRNQLLCCHSSWERVRLGDVAEVLNGFPFASEYFSAGGPGTPLIRIRDILRNQTETFYRGEYLPEFMVHRGDLLVGMDGDFNSSIWRGEPGLLNQRCCKISLARDGYDSRFLAYALPGYLSAINAHTSSITVKHLSSRTVSDIPLPLPPVTEQRRIANTLDELFSELDAGVAALERARAKLKLYRASVLKAAVEGVLTAEWRAQHPDTEPASELLKRILAERRHRWEAAQLKKFKQAGKSPPKNWKAKYKEPQHAAPTDQLALPATWTWVGPEELSDGVPHALKAGPFGSALKKSCYVPAGFKIYGQEQVIRNDPYYGDYFIDDDLFARLKSCAVKPGDILISLVGTTGKILVLPADAAQGIINPRLLKLSLLPSRVFADYLKLVLEGPHARAFYKAKAHGGTMDVLNLSILKEFPIPLPPLEEQKVVVEAVDEQLSDLDHLEADLDVKLKSAQALRQSILRDAFAGKLVPQDPDDEPASVLLERIAAARAQRESGVKAAKKAKSKPRATRKRAAGPARRTRT